MNLKTPPEEEPDDEDQVPELDETLTGMDYIPYTPQNEEEFFQQLEQWNDEDEYTRCIQALNAIPEDWRNYRIAYAMAQALENYAIFGDHQEGTTLLQGRKSPAPEPLNYWNWFGRKARTRPSGICGWLMDTSISTIRRKRPSPTPSGGRSWTRRTRMPPAVIQACQEEIAKRRRRAGRKKKAKFVPGAAPFEGFDFTNFWDDNEYALKEYVSAPPSDELIASVEEELGYKLPAAYIWLMKQHNGGIPVNDCYPTDEPTSWAEDHVAITGILGIGREKGCSLCGRTGEPVYDR